MLPCLLFVMCGNNTFKDCEGFFAPIYEVIFFVILYVNYKPMLMCLHRCFLHDCAGVVRYPFPPMARPPFLPRPGVTVGMVPQMPRPPFLGLRPPMTLPIVRPPVPVVMPVEKPQTTVYVGKIASSVESDFVRSLLELCGPIKSWKRAQDPSDGTPRRFGFCEFESAEGVLRALRLLSKCNVDGEELVLNVDQATRDYLERYVKKKKDNLIKPSETGAEEATKEGEGAPGVDKVEGNGKEEPAKTVVEEPKKDVNETENKENDTASFGLVTDEDRSVDREALEKLTSMIEERIRTKPLPPPPPPPAPKVVDGTNNLNSEVPSKSGDKDSDIDNVKNEDKIDDETTSETKPSNRAGTESPDRNRRYDNRSRDRDRREKERELDRLERERERERARRERERDLEIQKAERFYKERVKEWETREKEREYERKREREKEKERERERRRLISEQEDESDDDSRKRRRKSEIEDKRRRRRREKEEDMADRLKEEEEIMEAKKRAEEQQRQQEKQALELPSVPVANGNETPASLSPEVTASETKDDMEHDHDSAPAIAPPLAHAPVSVPALAHDPASHTGDVSVENGFTDEPMTASGSTQDSKLMGNAPAKKLGFGLVGSGKRTAVPSVFHEEEDDDAQKDKKMRPLVPIDYSTEELQAGHANDGEALPISAESGKRVNPREAKSDDRDRSRRSHDRSSHRDREHERGDEAPRPREILDAKQLIDMIPKTKEDLFSYEINWTVYDENRLHERMRPWISKKITEFLGEEETTLVEFIVDRFREHVKAEKMLDVLQRILDEEAEMFVLKMWRMLIFEIKKVETGLTTRPGA
ncbi:RNA-binding motif protein 25 isoform X2 [Spinacia oleracea]|uniref:RNA-binding motif protein 25 isoform X2 n=1 Tax=Spinacia oleracea TaxID=3562 RepID=A0A9R0JQ18_SPIOL|nr:RNA-binding motif protein 25 isoform X2 [Spinacia oleracea]XP_056682987.1 RNA-binding motif protein 25 isoform X2 [Spinacia oleracea]